MPITERSEADSVVETVKLTLAEFAKQMGPDVAPSDAVQVAQQENLTAALKLIFRKEEEVFNAAFKTFLDWVRTNIAGCMNVNSRSRGLQRAKRISSRDQDAVLLIVHLAAMVADPKARQAVIARFEFGRLDKIWPTTGGGDKMRNYFAQL